MLRSLLTAYTPLFPAAADVAATHVVLYATAIMLSIGILGHLVKLFRAAWRGVRRLERAAAALEELPEWRDAVDEDRAQLHAGLDSVTNLAEGIAREFGIPVRGRPQTR